LVFGEFDLYEEGFESECYGFFAVSGDFAEVGEFFGDFGFEGFEVVDYVFGVDFVGYND